MNLAARLFFHLALLALPAAQGHSQSGKAALENARAALEAIARPDSPPAAGALAKVREDAAGLDDLIARALAPAVLVRVTINPEMRVKLAAGSAPAKLVRGVRTPFLIEITNESGATARLHAQTPNAPASGAGRDGWLDVEIGDTARLPATLSGQPREYRIIWLRAHAAGDREARLAIHAGQGTQDIGFRNELDLLFRVSAE